MTGKNIIVVAVALLAILLASLPGPIPQDPVYHRFADQKSAFGLPNACNVLSSIPLIFVGAWGLAFLAPFLRRRRDAVLLEYFVFFAGLMLSGVGSSYYHYRPSNASLVWDRLPMTIAFMGFFSTVVSERIHRRAGAILLAPLLAAGLGSVGYWAWSESAGQGDLRPYAVVQFAPMILIPLILILYKPPKNYGIPIWSLLGLYLVSKVLEYFDQQVYTALSLASGHTLKHLVAALGAACVLKMLHERKSEFL